MDTVASIIRDMNSAAEFNEQLASELETSGLNAGWRKNLAEVQRLYAGKLTVCLATVREPVSPFLEKCEHCNLPKPDLHYLHVALHSNGIPVHPKTPMFLCGGCLGVFMNAGFEALKDVEVKC